MDKEFFKSFQDVQLQLFTLLYNTTGGGYTKPRISLKSFKVEGYKITFEYWDYDFDGGKKIQTYTYDYFEDFKRSLKC